MSDDRLTRAIEELVAAIRAEVGQPTTLPPMRLYNVNEVARSLSLGRSVLYQEIAAGRLKSVKVGRRRLVPESAVEAYIAERLETE